MNKSKFFKIFAVALSLIVVCNPTIAQTLCKSLKNILLDAKNEFKSYRGTFNFMMDEYEGTEIIGPLNSCKTESINGVASYTCSLDDLPDNTLDAKSIFATLDKEVKTCLGASIKVKNYSKAENRVAYDYLPERDDIEIRYQRFTPQSRRRVIPPSYSVIMSIETVDLFKK